MKANEAEFFESPILNSPYEEPGRYWELDENGSPTGRVLDGRRQAAYITPIARAKRDAATAEVQDELELGNHFTESLQGIGFHHARRAW